MDKRTEDDHIHVISVMSLVCGFRNHGFSNIQDKTTLTTTNQIVLTRSRISYP
jgi:hypothetical protein